MNKSDEKILKELDQIIEGKKDDTIVSFKLNLSMLSPVRFWRKYKHSSGRNKLFVGFGCVLFLILGVGAFGAVVFKLDSIVLPSTLEGKIYQGLDQPLEDAKICVGNTCDTTDEKGVYQLEGLSYGNRSVKIIAEGFQKYDEQVNLARGGNFQDFLLRVEGIKDFTGAFMMPADVAEIDYTKMEDIWLVAGEDKHTIKPKSDGTFVLNNIEIADNEIKIMAFDYKDFDLPIDPSEGVIDLGILELEPAGDLKFIPIDWLSQNSVDDIQLELKTKDKKGKLVGAELSIRRVNNKMFIEDLEVGGYYELIAKKSEFNNKKLTNPEIAQGINDLGNLSVVKAGKVVYVSNRTGNKNIYLSNYDGAGEKMLSDDRNDSYAPYFNEEAGTVHYLSTREGIKGSYNSYMALVYSVNVETGAISKISKNTYEDNNKDIGTLNLRAGKRAFVREHPSYPNTYQIMYGDINGTGAKQLAHLKRYPGVQQISDDGQYIMYRIDFYNEPDRSGMYLLNTGNLNQTQIYKPEDDNYSYSANDFSRDTEYGIMSVYDGAGWNLMMRDFSRGETTQITANTSQKSAIRVAPDTNYVSYISTRDGAKDVYMINVNDKKEVRLTRDGNVDNYFWQDGLLFYISEQKLWVFEVSRADKLNDITEIKPRQVVQSASGDSSYAGWN